MKSIAAIAVALGLAVTPALAETAEPRGADAAEARQQAETDGAAEAAEASVAANDVMGREVVSSDGTTIGNVVDVLAAPDGSVVAVAVVDPEDPLIGLAVAGEMLSRDGDRLVADISDAEIAALPDPEIEGDGTDADIQ